MVAVVLPAAGAVPSRGEASQNGSLAFAGKRLGEPVIYMREPDLGGLRVVPTSGWAGDPALSPGGRRVAFVRRGGDGSQVWATYPNGTGLIQLTSGPQDGNPDWSPAGDAVAFARGSAERRDIYTVTSDGTTLRRLTHRLTDDHSPSWSVLSTAIGFSPAAAIGSPHRRPCFLPAGGNRFSPLRGLRGRRRGAEPVRARRSGEGRGANRQARGITPLPAVAWVSR